jgi:hypothetical protein
MNPLSIIHTFGAAATSIVRASADMFASASVSSLVVLVVKAPHIEVSDRMLSPPALTPSSVWPPPTPSSASGWTRTNKSDGPRIKSLVNSICEAHLVLFLNFMHAVRQSMHIPLILHKPFCYTTGFHQEILKNRSIVGMSQFS